MNKRVLIIVAALVVLLIALYFAISGFKKSLAEPEPNFNSQPTSQATHKPQKATNSLASQWSRGKCEGDGDVDLTRLPMDLSDFSHYLPYGMMTGAHVTPIDHGYLSPADFNSPRDSYPVYAVADGFIVEVGHRASFPDGADGANRETDEYRVIIEHSCSFYSYFDLATSLDPVVAAEIPKYGQKDNWTEAVRIPITSGQEVGRIGGQTLDFGVYNDNVTLGFLSPELYEREFWKIHTDDPFKYFTPELREQFLAKNTRAAEPVAGKIDYDQAGTLLGNWFEEGTNGYQGAGELYWEGHLAIAYDFLDPTQIRISTGDPRFKGGPYGVTGNSPNPAEVTPETGLVSYELTEYSYINAQTGENVGRSVMEPGEYTAENSTQANRGYLLVELMPDERLKAELFPDSTSTPASFTDAAKIFER